MTIHPFVRLQYDSFVCLAFDTDRYRYWFDISKPFSLERFPSSFVDDLGVSEMTKKDIRIFGLPTISFQWPLSAVCHVIHHVKVSFWNKRHCGASLIKELFTRYNEHQSQVVC